MSATANAALNRLYDENLSFRLYADYANGMSIPELAVISFRSEQWVAERIEAMRLCFEKQVVVRIAGSEQCPEPRIA